MATPVNLQLTFKFENGPAINSQGKFEVGSYLHMEETLCRCSDWHDIDLKAGLVSDVQMIVITADKYSGEKDMMCSPISEKRIYVRFPAPGPKGANGKSCDGAKPADPKAAGSHSWDAHPLAAPLIISSPYIECLPDNLEYVCFKNELPMEVKVSVLVVRKKPMPMNGDNSQNRCKPATETQKCCGTAAASPA
jgi:hypothetical protein